MIPRTPINNLEAILIAYLLGAATALTFNIYGKLIERSARKHTTSTN